MKCRLKVIFAEYKISQREFSKKNKISESTLSLIVREKQIPSIPMALKITKGLRNLGIQKTIEEIWVIDDEE